MRKEELRDYLKGLDKKSPAQEEKSPVKEEKKEQPREFKEMTGKSEVRPERKASLIKDDEGTRQEKEYLRRPMQDRTRPGFERRPQMGERPQMGTRPQMGERLQQPKPEQTEQTEQKEGIRFDPGSFLTPEQQAELDSGIEKNGILEIMPDGFGFIRCDNYLPGDNDVYVAPAQIKRFGLRSGDIIRGNTKIRTATEKFSALLYIKTINGYTIEETAKRKKFENLTPVFPYERIHLETSKSTVA